MTNERERTSPRLPPRWFIRLAWSVHRGLYRVTRGRVGLWRARSRRWGALRLTTTGRRTGRRRSVFVGYFEDGPHLVTLAMNGWGAAEPAWWLNLQAHPDAEVEVADGPRRVTARAAAGDERARLWARWREIDANLDAYAALRPYETTVVILQPRIEPER
ncbi:nitroreductase/quinone reductase family protein [Streptomyces apocyni]|uniref:nitroreductase/quinone reductase family protein n=1 Tax=Streptomyces apocyni TaxID=2654677 RepID=UPI0012EAD9CA|nr:nitroreductase/quinone reductase family protein [Streptomyces apocyni]